MTPTDVVRTQLRRGNLLLPFVVALVTIAALAATMIAVLLRRGDGNWLPLAQITIAILAIFIPLGAAWRHAHGTEVRRTVAFVESFGALVREGECRPSSSSSYLRLAFENGLILDAARGKDLAFQLYTDLGGRPFRPTLEALKSGAPGLEPIRAMIQAGASQLPLPSDPRLRELGGRFGATREGVDVRYVRTGTSDLPGPLRVVLLLCTVPGWVHRASDLRLALDEIERELRAVPERRPRPAWSEGW